MRSIDIDATQSPWRKSRRSINNGACVEVASAPASVLVRDSVNPDGGAIRYPARTWRTFLAAAKTGGYDIVER